MFMNTFFTYAFMGLVVSINIQLMGISLTGGQGGLDAIEEALNGNSVKVLSDLLDIGFAGFLILIASCIFGFKLCGQAAELAGSEKGVPVKINEIFFVQPEAAAPPEIPAVPGCPGFLTGFTAAERVWELLCRRSTQK